MWMPLGNSGRGVWPAECVEDVVASALIPMALTHASSSSMLLRVREALGLPRVWPLRGHYC